MAIPTLILVLSIFPCVTLACSEIDESCCTDITSGLNKMTGMFSQVLKLLQTEAVALYQAKDTGTYWQDCYQGMASQGTSDQRKLVALPGKKLALCDTHTDGGGWIVIQRRARWGQSFNQNWNSYKYGFGDVQNGDDYWLGLDTIHNITSSRPCELRIDMAYEGKNYYANYATFLVGSEATGYRLTVDKYSGNSGDSLTQHNQKRFSTPDRDNDLDPEASCAKSYEGGWWFQNCYASYLNGAWGLTDYKGINWITDSIHHLTFAEMKIRLIKD